MLLVVDVRNNGNQVQYAIVIGSDEVQFLSAVFSAGYASDRCYFNLSALALKGGVFDWLFIAQNVNERYR